MSIHGRRVYGAGPIDSVGVQPRARFPRGWMGRLLGLGVSCVLGLPLHGQIPGALPGKADARTRVEALDDGRLRLGGVRIDPVRKEVSFDARVNLNDVLVEYGVVGEIGKLHESLLACEVKPHHLHAAMLLLGVRDLRPTAVRDRYPPGHPVRIKVAWKDKEDGRQQTAFLEDWVLRDSDEVPMSRGPWVYSGARVVDGDFTAETDQSIVSIILDMDALVNNPRPGNENDEIWVARRAVMPAVGTPVTVTIALESTWTIGVEKASEEGEMGRDGENVQQ